VVVVIILGMMMDTLSRGMDIITPITLDPINDLISNLNPDVS
jgi:hypothetical protein